MRVLYNAVLAILHYIGSFLFAAICFSRFAFAPTWSREEEISFILCGLFVFGIHYLLLWIGNKKCLISRRVVRGLQIWELIIFLPQFAVILFVFILSFNFKNLPLLLLHIGVYAIILLLRWFSGKKIDTSVDKGQGDGLCEPF